MLAFTALQHSKSDTETTEPTATADAQETSWDSLGLSPEVLQIVQQAGFIRPTPVQAKAIPFALDNQDLIVSAQTGSGKTAAFALPMIERLKGRKGTYGLVLAPSREIALQTKAVLDSLGTPLGVTSISLIGGIDMKIDAAALNMYPQIIVATPGRLCDHLERGNVWLDYLEIVVLDEADRMLDMGFSDQLNRIMKDTPNTRQTLLFSATMPRTVEALAQKILYQPKRISIGKPVSAAPSVEQNFIYTDEESKFREVQKLIQTETGSIFIFTRSKEGASKLWRNLHRLGYYDATHLHSDLRQCDREKALEEFKAGKYRIMIATDVIGRGIHVDGVAHVINYDLPMEPEDYIHRIGRTGRADAKGKATSLITPRDKFSLRKIQALTGQPVQGPVQTHPQDRSPRRRRRR